MNVDGGMTASELLLQIQADILGVEVVRPTITETTVLGAAYAAGLAVGVWPDLPTLRAQWKADRRWQPSMSTTAARRQRPTRVGRRRPENLALAASADRAFASHAPELRWVAAE